MRTITELNPVYVLRGIVGVKVRYDTGETEEFCTWNKEILVTNEEIVIARDSGYEDGYEDGCKAGQCDADEELKEQIEELEKEVKELKEQLDEKV